MKFAVTLFSILFFINSAFAQSKFEPGYFINSDGIKSECFIKNEDWKSNPEEIEYKSNLASETQKIGKRDLKEFAIEGVSKYKKHKVLVDKFDESTIDIHLELNYDYQEDTVLLKILVEGKASLYLYEGSNFRRYFFSTEKLPPEQLIYKAFKRYVPLGGINKLVNTKLEYNRLYRLQLYDHLKCEGIEPETIAKVRFKKNSLVKFFNTYNYCQRSESINYHNLKERDHFNLTARIGFGRTRLNAINRNFNSFSFSNRLSYKIGIEAEYVLPYHNGRWSLTFEPAFVRFSESDSISNFSVGTISYNAIQTAIGFRYNHQLSSDTKIYATIVHAPEFSFNSELNRGVQTYEVNTINNYLVKDFSFGIGLVTKKLNLELRHHFDRLIDPVFSNNLEYGVTYLIIGYQLF